LFFLSFCLVLSNKLLIQNKREKILIPIENVLAIIFSFPLFFNESSSWCKCIYIDLEACFLFYHSLSLSLSLSLCASVCSVEINGYWHWLMKRVKRKTVEIVFLLVSGDYSVRNWLFLLQTINLTYFHLNLYKYGKEKISCFYTFFSPPYIKLVEVTTILFFLVVSHILIIKILMDF